MNIGVEKRPRIADSQFYVPPDNASIQEMNVISNFDGNRIAVADTKDGVDGEVYVYDYDSVSNTWSTPVVITCPTAGATNYGSSISMDWDGTRVVVGASTISTVYVYDLVAETGVVSSTQVITGTSGTDFGFSVSLAANVDDVLCIGAPLGSSVFVYELDEGTWTQKFTDSGTTIKNRLPLTPTSNVVLKNHLSRYGFHVSISPNGRHIAAGAPGFVEYRTGSGTVLDPYKYDLTTTHIETIETAPGETVQQPPYKLGATYYKFLGNLMRQLGNVRVFTKGGNPSWSSGVSKIGNDIEGDPDNVLLTALSVSGTYRIRPTFPENDYAIISGWSFPALGMCTHVTDDMVLTASSPLTPTDTDRGLCTGKVNTFRLVGGTWERYGSAIASPFNTMEFGKSFSIDYSGNRIASTGSNSELFVDNARVISSIITVHDWNGTEWYEAQPVMGLVEVSYVSGFRTFDRLSVSINTGEHVFCVSAKYRVVVTKNAPLTQLFQGNSLFSGYISTSDLFVGINNADDLNTSSKKISFGGTYRDQAYDLTTIENRSMIPLDNGRSELLLAKRTGNSGAIDFIRIKANEIHLDSFRAESIQVRNPDASIIGTESILSIVDNKTLHSPALIVNARGCVCINHPVTPELRTSYSYVGSVASNAFLDVNGDALIRNKMTVNHAVRSELKGVNQMEPYIFYDTRDPAITYSESGTNRVKSKTQPRQVGESSIYGVISGDTVTYSEAFKSFEFGGSGTGKIQNFLNGTLDHEPLRFSMWLRLNNDHSTYTESNCFSISSIESFRYKQTQCTLQLVSTGFKVLYRDLKNPSNTFSFSTSTTVPANTWTHVELRLPAGRENIPSPKTSIEEIMATETDRRAAVALWINTVIQSSPWTTVGTPNVNFLGFNRVELILGGNLANAYVGMFMAWNIYAYAAGINNMIGYVYNNGPPTEMLAVGGDAVVSGKLAVGTTNPTKALEVVGDASFTGSVTAGSFVGALDAGNVTSGTLAVARGGTGVTTSTGTGSVVLNTNPIFGGSIGIGQTPSFPYATCRLHTYQFNLGDGSINEIWKHSFDPNWAFSLCQSHIGNANARFTFRSRANGVDYDVMGFLFDRVGIGTTYPERGKLEISGTGLSSSYTYAYLTGTGALGGPTTFTKGYSLYTSDSIACSELNVFSDERIKKNIIDIVDDQALEKLRLLKPKTYQYIDEKTRGDSTVFGFIAQEVQEVLPYAVSVSKGPIPNIMTDSNVVIVDEQHADLYLDKPLDITLSNISVLNITTSDDVRITCNVVSMVSNSIIRVEQFGDVEGAYIHGQEVDDFHHLNKNAIWTVATAALQEVDRQLQTEKAKVTALEAQMATVLARLDALTS